MLLSDKKLKIRSGTVGYNNKILISDEKFSLGKNDEVNETPKISHEPTITHELAKKPRITNLLTQAQKPTLRSGALQGPHNYELAKKPTHEDERITLVLFLTGGFVIRNIFL